MKVKIKYRDIPFEQAMLCSTEKGIQISSLIGEKNWNLLRNNSFYIETPAITEEQWEYVKCGGPFFNVINPPFNGILIVCPHLAEIGD